MVVIKLSVYSHLELLARLYEQADGNITPRMKQTYNNRFGFSLSFWINGCSTVFWNFFKLYFLSWKFINLFCFRQKKSVYNLKLNLIYSSMKFLDFDFYIRYHCYRYDSVYVQCLTHSKKSHKTRNIYWSWCKYHSYCLTWQRPEYIRGIMLCNQQKVFQVYTWYCKTQTGWQMSHLVAHMKLYGHIIVSTILCTNADFWVLFIQHNLLTTHSVQSVSVFHHLPHASTIHAPWQLTV